jgi:hypothetical protein
MGAFFPIILYNDSPILQVTSWQQGQDMNFFLSSRAHSAVCRLPLDSVMLVISELLPKVQSLQVARHMPNPTSAIMDLLRSATLTHVLPSTPPLTPRRFIVSCTSVPLAPFFLTQRTLAVV